MNTSQFIKHVIETIYSNYQKSLIAISKQVKQTLIQNPKNY
jgi:hypothetical protein